MQICLSRCSFMVIYLLGNGQTSFVEPRLTKLGIRVQNFSKDSIRDLNHDTVEMIYLLPFKTLLESDWPHLRVRLAQANRCYIVVSDTLSSAEIMTAARDGAYDVLRAHPRRVRRWQGARGQCAARCFWPRPVRRGKLCSHPQRTHGSRAVRRGKRSLHRRLQNAGGVG